MKKFDISVCLYQTRQNFQIFHYKLNVSHYLSKHRHTPSVCRCLVVIPTAGLIYILLLLGFSSRFFRNAA